MEAIPVNTITTFLETHRKNPNAQQRMTYDLLEKASNGELNLVDPTTPMTLLYEMNAVTSADLLGEMEALTRRTYPKLSTTEEELYGHISDNEYLGVWGQPSGDNFVFAFDLNELKHQAIRVQGQTYSKVVIPRETAIVIAGTEFGFAYPIEIRFNSSGSVTVLYDTRVESPFMTLSTNIIEYNVVRFQDRELLMFAARGLQYALDSRVLPISTTTPITTTITLKDELYYCRVYHREQGASWKEMSTTYSGRIYDTTVPTATLKRHDGKLTVKVPEIYLTNKLLGSELRIDIFTTKGDISLALADYSGDQATYRWNDFDPEDNGAYSAVVSNLTFKSIVGESTTTGGRNGLTFAELRSRVVNNSSKQPVPITNQAIMNRLSDTGYNVTTVVDNITDRKYLATRTLPVPTTNNSSSPIGSTVETVLYSPEAMKSISTVKQSGDIISVLPESFYKRVGTAIQFVSDMEKDELEILEPDALIRRLESEEYYFTPYLTVLDSTEDIFNYNCYLIDKPKVTKKNFEADNTRTDYKSTAVAFVLNRISTGYRLVATVRGDGGHQDLLVEKVGLQLAFTPQASSSRVYLEGEKLGRNPDGDLVFRFDINTDFSVRKGHNLELTNFKMISNDTLDYPVTPETRFDFIHYVTGTELTNDNKGDIQNLLGTMYAPSDSVVLTHETANLRLLEHTDGLVNRSRVSVPVPTYRKWAVDVPDTWPEDVYEKDATGHLRLVDNGESFEPILVHKQGDVKTHPETGETVYKHRAGDIMLENGEPIIENKGDRNYYLEMMLLDGRYRYANATGSVDYRESIGTTLVDWLRDDIASISETLLARTKILFAPKSTVGEITVSSIEGERRKIPAALNVKVDFYMNLNGYSNQALRQSIIDFTRSAAVSELAKTQISTGALQEQLRSLAGEEVLAIKVHPFYGSDLDAFIIQDEGSGTSLAKRMELQSDNKLALVDALDVNFIKHRN